jgi:predicted ATP-dependent serine protease
MAYYCNDCSYRGKTRSESGQCPACGSYNMSVPRAHDRGADGPPRWHSFALVASWSLLLVAITWKLLH